MNTCINICYFNMHAYYILLCSLFLRLNFIALFDTYFAKKHWKVLFWNNNEDFDLEQNLLNKLENSSNLSAELWMFSNNLNTVSIRSVLDSTALIRKSNFYNVATR